MLQLYDDILERYSQERNANMTDDDDQCTRHAVIEGFYTFNKSFADVLKGIERIAQYDATILLTGGTGTGKTMLAKRSIKSVGGKALSLRSTAAPFRRI